jgi:hypothetical protein
MQPAAVEGASKQQPLQVGKQASTKECDTAPLLKGPATDSELRPPTVSFRNPHSTLPLTVTSHAMPLAGNGQCRLPNKAAKPPFTGEQPR